MKRLVLLLLAVSVVASEEMPPQITQVYEGEPFNITIRVWNNADIPNKCMMVYYDNSTENKSIIAWQEINFEPNSPTWASVIWNATGIGVHRIYIKIENPQNDTDKDNNIASKEIQVIKNENKTTTTETTTNENRETTTTTTKEEEQKDNTPQTTTTAPRLDDATNQSTGGDDTTTGETNQGTTTTLEEAEQTPSEDTTSTTRSRGNGVAKDETINYVLVVGVIILVYLFIRKRKKNDDEIYSNPRRDNNGG